MNYAPVFSTTGLKVYERCPLKYKFIYIDQDLAGEKIEYFLRSRIFEAIMYCFAEPTSSPLTKQRLLKYFTQRWHDELHGELLVAAGSFKEDFFNLGKKCLDNFVNSSSFDQKPLCTMLLTRIRLDRRGTFPLLSLIERLDRIDERSYRVHKYEIPGADDYCSLVEGNDWYICFQQLGLHARFPDARKVEFVLHNLENGDEVKNVVSGNALKKARTKALELISQIGATSEYWPEIDESCTACQFRTRCIN